MVITLLLIFCLSSLEIGSKKEKIFVFAIHIHSLNTQHSVLNLHACMLNHSVMSNSLPPHGLQPTRLLWPWDSPGNNTELDCRFLLQGVFLTQGSNPHLLSAALQVDYLPTEPSGKPRVDYGKFQNEEIGSWCLLLHFSVLCSDPPLRYFPMVEQHKEIDIIQFAGWGLLDLNLEPINY